MCGRRPSPPNTNRARSHGGRSMNTCNKRAAGCLNLPHHPPTVPAACRVLRLCQPHVPDGVAASPAAQPATARHAGRRHRTRPFLAHTAAAATTTDATTAAAMQSSTLVPPPLCRHRRRHHHHHHQHLQQPPLHSHADPPPTRRGRPTTTRPPPTARTLRRKRRSTTLTATIRSDRESMPSTTLA